MPKFFNLVEKDSEGIYCRLPEKGYGHIVSINGIDAEKLLSTVKGWDETDLQVIFNNNLPKLMEEAGGEETERYELVFDSAKRGVETIVLDYPTELLNTVKKNFAGITGLGKAGGLTDEDMAALFFYAGMTVKAMGAEVVGNGEEEQEHQFRSHMRGPFGGFSDLLREEIGAQDVNECQVQ